MQHLLNVVQYRDPILYVVEYESRLLRRDRKKQLSKARRIVNGIQRTLQVIQFSVILKTYRSTTVARKSAIGFVVYGGERQRGIIFSEVFAKCAGSNIVTN